RRGATCRLAALPSRLRLPLGSVRSLIVVPLAHSAEAQHVGSLHSPPGCDCPSAPFARSSLSRSLTPPRRNMSARCTPLPVAPAPRLRSLAHRCPARSLRRGATCRLAALPSRLRL